MKQLLIILSVLALSISSYANEPIKQVIFIIGDGMGLNQMCKLDSPNHFERANYIGLSKTTRGDRHSSRVEAKKPALLSSRDGYLWELTGWTQGSQAS